MGAAVLAFVTIKGVLYYNSCITYGALQWHSYFITSHSVTSNFMYFIEIVCD